MKRERTVTRTRKVFFIISRNSTVFDIDTACCDVIRSRGHPDARGTSRGDSLRRRSAFWDDTMELQAVFTLQHKPYKQVTVVHAAEVVRGGKWTFKKVKLVPYSINECWARS